MTVHQNHETSEQVVLRTHTDCKSEHILDAMIIYEFDVFAMYSGDHESTSKEEAEDKAWH